MKAIKKGTLSGCLIWLVVFVVLCACLSPFVMITGSITSTVTGDTVARILGPRLCPEGTTAEIYTYETTTTDADGFETPTTAFEMRCLDASGAVAEDLGPTYAFIWMGLLAAGGALLAAVLAFALAAPAGALLARIMHRKQAE